MLLEQLEAKKDFTNSEAQIAAYLLAHPFAPEQLTAAQLAERTYTSKATVTRLCRKLGCESYREFQQTLSREQTVRQQIDARLNTSPSARTPPMRTSSASCPPFMKAPFTVPCLKWKSRRWTAPCGKFSMPKRWRSTAPA